MPITQNSLSQHEFLTYFMIPCRNNGLRIKRHSSFEHSDVIRAFRVFWHYFEYYSQLHGLYLTWLCNFHRLAVCYDPSRCDVVRSVRYVMHWLRHGVSSR